MKILSYLKKIEYNSTPPCNIPIGLQIEILLKVKEEMLLSNSDCQRGLCNLITNTWLENKNFEDLDPYCQCVDTTETYIAQSIICILNMENAINFANGRDELYWWPIQRKLTLSEKIHKYGFNLKKYLEVSTTYNIEPRIKFLNWCIKTLKDYESNKKV